jgi:hypothetical protein
VWPCLVEILELNCAICWNGLEYNSTSHVSLIELAGLVKILSIRKPNQPVTKCVNDLSCFNIRTHSHLVGTSETTRVTSLNAADEADIIFNQ